MQWNESREAGYLIWSNEHRMWWKVFQRGYTADIKEAGVYEFHEAVKIVGEANEHVKGVEWPHEVMVQTIYPMGDDCI